MFIPSDLQSNPTVSHPKSFNPYYYSSDLIRIPPVLCDKRIKAEMQLIRNARNERKKKWNLLWGHHMTQVDYRTLVMWQRWFNKGARGSQQLTAVQDGTPSCRPCFTSGFFSSDLFDTNMTSQSSRTELPLTFYTVKSSISPSLLNVLRIIQLWVTWHFPELFSDKPKVLLYYFLWDWAEAAESGVPWAKPSLMKRPFKQQFLKIAAKGGAGKLQ